MGKKLIYFVLFTNLGSSAGTETTTINYVKNLLSIDNTLNISIIQTNYVDNNNKPIYNLENVSANIITLKSPFSLQIYKKLKNRILLNIIYREIIYPFFYVFLNHREMRRLSTLNAVYYFAYQNDVIPWVLNNPNLRFRTIVSGQCKLTPYSKNPLVFLKNKCIRLFSRKIHYLTSIQKDAFKRYNAQDFTLKSGVDSKKFVLKDNKNSSTRFLFVSRIEKNKGILELLDAFKMFDNPEFELMIAGTGKYSDIASSVNSNNYSYLGFVDEKDLPEIYASADIFIYPTYGETFGLVVVEAVSSGLFCLVSNKLRGIFDDLEELGAIKYIDNTVDSIYKYLNEYQNYKVDYNKKLKWHNYVEENYGWYNLSKKLYNYMMDM